MRIFLIIFRAEMCNKPQLSGKGRSYFALAAHQYNHTFGFVGLSFFCGSGAQQDFLFPTNFRCTKGATFGTHPQHWLPPINPLWPPTIWMGKLLFFPLLLFFFQKSYQTHNILNFFQLHGCVRNWRKWLIFEHSGLFTALKLVLLLLD